MRLTLQIAAGVMVGVLGLLGLLLAIGAYVDLSVDAAIRRAGEHATSHSSAAEAPRQPREPML